MKMCENGFVDLDLQTYQDDEDFEFLDLLINPPKDLTELHRRVLNF